MAIDFKILEKLVLLTKKHKLAELEIEDPKFKVRIKTTRGLTSNVINAPTAFSSNVKTSLTSKASAEIEEDTKHTKINSPFVGTFYRSPSPDAEPYAKENQMVKKGDVLCIVEAMKLMNEIESDVNGRIVSILAQNGQPVEYDQPLFLIDPV